MIRTAEIALVDLPALQVARFLFFGLNPADDGLAQVVEWAEQHDLREERYPLFGMRTSLPIVTDPQYGYAYLVALDPAAGEELGIDLMTLPEGRHAVTRVWVPEEDPYAVIDEGWARLKAWLGEAPYARDDRPAMERHYPGSTAVAPFPLDLYLPVVRLPQADIRSNGDSIF